MKKNEIKRLQNEQSIDDLSSSRGNDLIELRNTRNNSRDVEEITMPDGSKFIKRKRSVLGKTDRLYIEPKEGYKRHWFNAVESSRIQYAIDLGFVPATDINGNPIEPQSGDLNQKGERKQLFCMEIPIEEWAKIQKNTKNNREKRKNEIRNEMETPLNDFGKSKIFEDNIKTIEKIK